MSKQQSIKAASNELPAHMQAILAGKLSLSNTELNSPATKTVNTKQQKIKEAQQAYAPVTVSGETVTNDTISASALASVIDDGEELETHDLNGGDNTHISIE